MTIGNSLGMAAMLVANGAVAIPIAIIGIGVSASRDVTADFGGARLSAAIDEHGASTLAAS
ncbi:MAG: hypothetical protein AAGJ32_02860 [Pseudomonadota bacterium]